MASQREQHLRKVGSEGFGMIDQREQHLQKIGSEGFGLIDEFFGRKRRSNQKQQQRLQAPQPQVYQSNYQYQYFYNQHQPSQVYTVTKEPVANYHGTSQHHQFYNDGRNSIYEGPQVSVVNESVVKSNETGARGSTMVIDYSKTEWLGRAYY